MKTAPKRTLMLGFALNLQNFLLRRNWMGSAGNYIMVLTTSGRKTGKKWSVPIGYLRLNDDIIAINHKGISNWYRNLKANGQALLEIKGEKIQATAHIVSDNGESQALFNAFLKEPVLFERLMRISPDAPQADLDKTCKNKTFVRFKYV
jgi:deazaflavin-dependent oxidoreductase (nitroreductase family)